MDKKTFEALRAILHNIQGDKNQQVSVKLDDIKAVKSWVDKVERLKQEKGFVLLV